jgi:hypothetical protein
MLERGLAVAAALMLTPWGSASAQVVFPGDAAYSPWPCQAGVMIDPVHDEAGATAERDLVGEEAAPAGLRAADSQFLYLRLRVDSDPRLGTARAWGFLVDTDGDASTYEVLLAADGGTQTVSIYTNTTSQPGDARDPPDAPALMVYTWTDRAGTQAAPASSFGGTPDYFVDFAFPWTDLALVGITPSTPLRVWAASATSASNGMNGDFACWNGGADVALGDDWPRTVGDPGQDSDGDGFSDATEIEHGTDPFDVRSQPGASLAGGGGCHHGSSGALALAFAFASLLWARRRAARA